jgi:subtilase family serine protease
MSRTHVVSAARLVLAAGVFLLASACGGPGSELEEVDTVASQALTTAPDFIVSAVSAPAQVRPGTAFTVTVTVCNQGTQEAPSVPVDLVLSTDSVVSTSDLLLVRLTAGTTAPGQCVSHPVSASTTAATGTYVLGAIVDPGNGRPELSEVNNTGSTPMVLTTLADLEVRGVYGPGNAVPAGTGFSSTVTVCNVGTQAAGSFLIELYLSADTTIDRFQDTRLGTVSVAGANPGACLSMSVQAVANPSGNWKLGAVVDSSGLVSESSEGNNAAAGAELSIGTGPDLVVNSISGYASAPPMSAMSLTAQVCNRGSADAAASVAELVFSSDAVVDAGDHRHSRFDVPALAKGACVTVNPSGFVPPAGLYRLGARADVAANAAELREDNNSRIAAEVAVGTGPDLLISRVSGVPTLRSGAAFTATVVVCNMGTVPAPAGVSVSVHLSGDAHLSTRDYGVGRAEVPALGTSACATVSVPCTTHWTEASYTLGAIVDPGGALAELREDNNTRLGSSFVVDNTPPATPVVTGTSPNLIGKTTLPRVLGTSEVSARVRVFTNGTCTGTSVGMSEVDFAGSFSVSATAAANTTTLFYVQAQDQAGNFSGCSNAKAYTHDGIAPSIPRITGFTPGSGSGSTTPLVQGVAEPNARLLLFTNATCTGTPVHTTTVASSDAWAVQVSVASGTTATFHASAVDAVGNVSGCSAGASYTP